MSILAVRSLAHQIASTRQRLALQREEFMQTATMKTSARPTPSVSSEKTSSRSSTSTSTSTSDLESLKPAGSAMGAGDDPSWLQQRRSGLGETWQSFSVWAASMAYCTMMVF